MLYDDPKNIEIESVDIDPIVATLVNTEFTALMKQVRADYRTWRTNGYFVEVYLAGKMLEFIKTICENGGEYVDPYQRYDIITICADPKKKPADIKKTLDTYVKLCADIDWGAVIDRAKTLKNALDRSAAVATIVIGDRLWEEYRIVAKKQNLISQNAIGQSVVYVKSVNETLRQLLRALRHATFLKITGLPTVLLTESGVKSYFPKVEVYDQVVDGAIECLNLTGIFIPVVQKTITEQRNPFMLYAFTQDLVLIFEAISKYGSKLTEEILRLEAGDYARVQELKDRTIIWMENLIASEYTKKQLSRPFAQKILTALNNGSLGRGSISKVLQERVAKSSPKVRREAAQVLQEVINQSTATVLGVRLSAVANAIIWDDKNQYDQTATLVNMQASQLLPQNTTITNKDQLQLKELALIVSAMRSF